MKTIDKLCTCSRLLLVSMGDSDRAVAEPRPQPRRCRLVLLVLRVLCQGDLLREPSRALEEGHQGHCPNQGRPARGVGGAHGKEREGYPDGLLGKEVRMARQREEPGGEKAFLVVGGVVGQAWSLAVLALLELKLLLVCSGFKSQRCSKKKTGRLVESRKQTYIEEHK